jgi:hypothetical protein
MHEENLPFKKILEFLFSLIKPSGYIIVEFVGAEDPRYKLIQNPNYPYSTQILDFEDSVLGLGEISLKEKLAPSRYLYLIKIQ